MNEPASRFFRAANLKLHYLDWGKADLPVLILVHGGRDHCRGWDWAAKKLSDEWRVITPDLRGHGDSDWSPDGDYSPTSFVYDLACLVEHLGTSPVSIVGHSLGGSITTNYTALYPGKVRRLVCIEGLGYSPKQVAEKIALPADVRIRRWIDTKQTLDGQTPKSYATLDDACARMQKMNPHLSAEQAEYLTRHGTRQNDDGRYCWKFDQHVRGGLPLDLSPEEQMFLWEQITCPVLLVYGADSWASMPDEDGRIGRFRDARVSRYPDAGHWAHLDQPERFVSEIRAFLT